MKTNKRGRVREGSIVERIVQRNGKRQDKSGNPIKVKVSKWFARVTFIDQAGKRKDRLRAATSKTNAKELIKDMLQELKDDGDAALDHADLTFRNLADYYEKNYLVAAEYVAGQKVTGLRSLATPKGFLITLRNAFGMMMLNAITHGDIRKFRNHRLKAPTRGDIARHHRALAAFKEAKKKNRKAEPPKLQVTRAIASVNRELMLLHRMLNVALQEGWIRKHPMHGGDGLISVAGERQRSRILTVREEARLLAACTGKRVHLKAIVVAALESGMRKGELLKLKWADVDLEHRMIAVVAFNTKTQRARDVAITSRLALELERLWNESEKNTGELVFGIRIAKPKPNGQKWKGITDDVKKSFDSARREAGLPDVRFHDLRHTYATRLIAGQIPLTEVGRLLGHTLPQTTFRYTNIDHGTARRAADVLDAMRIDSGAVEESAMVN